MRLLLIVWHDAVSNHAGWASKAEVARQEPPVVRSVGWEIRRTKRKLTLASSIMADECSGDLTIPLGMIVSEKELAV